MAYVQAIQAVNNMRGLPLPTPVPQALAARCKNCDTLTVWSTYYVDQDGKSTTCTTTEYDATTVTSRWQASPTSSYHTVYQTLTSTLAPASSATPTSTGISTPAAESIQVQGDACGCRKDWLQFLMGGVPYGVAEILACIIFFLLFALFFLCSIARLAKFSASRPIFLILVPFCLFLATMVAFFPTRAYAAGNDSTGHVLAENVMFLVAPPLVVDVSLQIYSLLRRRAEPSGWIDASSLFLRALNVAALVLYAIAAADLVNFVNGWQLGLQTCASTLPRTIATLLIIADIIELLILLLGFICLGLARWRLRMAYPVLLIQAGIWALLFIFFIWHMAHDLAAAKHWSSRFDKQCNPLPAAAASGSSTSGPKYFFNMPWSAVQFDSHEGINGQAAFWLLCILPLFLATLLLMAVNLVVYTECEPVIMPLADSVRYKLCYNEDTKKMEFVRLDNVGGPQLADGEQLYEIVRQNDGEGWQIREATVPTVLPVTQNLTVKPWYK